MPSRPTGKQTRIDTLLTDFAQGYGLEIKGNYISDFAATHYRSKNPSDKYLKTNKGDLRRVSMQPRAPGQEALRTGLTMSNERFVCETYALATELTDEDRAESQADDETIKTEWLMHQAKLKQEKLWAAACFDTGIWSGFTDQAGVANPPGANQFVFWDDYVNSTPILNITARADDLRKQYGGKPPPNIELVSVCGPAVWQVLRNHPDFVDRIKYTSSVAVAEDIVARLLGIDRFLVGKAAENTAAEGQAAVMADVFGKGLWIGYLAKSYDKKTSSAATMFHWSEFDFVSEDGAEIRTWREESKHQDVFEAQISLDVKVTATDLGGFFNTAVQ